MFFSITFTLLMFQSNGKRAVGYFNFVIHPHHFGHTVENMFHVSFLVKERKVKISLDEESGLPLIEPIGRATVEVTGRNMTEK